MKVDKSYSIENIKKYIGKEILCKRDCYKYKAGKFYLLHTLEDYECDESVFDNDIDNNCSEIDIQIGEMGGYINDMRDIGNAHWFRLVYNSGGESESKSRYEYKIQEFHYSFEIITKEELRIRKIKSILE